MTSAATLADALAASARLDRGITYLEGEGEPLRLTYQAVMHRARRLLGEFQRRGLESGANVVLLLDGNPQLVDAFWTCQLGGLVAIPLAVGGTDEHQLKTLNVLDQLDDPTLITQGRNPERLWEYARRKGVYAAYESVFATEINISQLAADGPLGSPLSCSPDATAALQFSSGSTGTPKGVVLTHAALLADIHAIIERGHMTEHDSHLSWVPLTHDLGMVMFHLLPIVLGVEQYLMPPARFARRPLSWLQQASAVGATVLCSPNFGYDHYLKSFAKADEKDLDLSRVRIIFNGGEPISRQVCDAFTEALGGHGLSPTAIRPAYGLAEACVCVTMTPPGSPVASLHVERERLLVGEEVALTDERAGGAEVVCVGTPVEGCEVRIGDGQGEALRDGVYGRILIRGAMVTTGYYGREREGDADEWFDTGDLGFCMDGSLYVLGRSKDTIIVNGVNYHPNDLERICQEDAGLEVGKVTCCGVTHREGEQLAVFVVHRQDLENFRHVVKAVRRAIGERCQLEVGYVLPVRQMPKTTSGKIQRFKLVDDFRSGAFDDAVAFLEEEPDRAGGLAQSDLARALHGLFNAVLLDVHLGVDDNFLDLGVSSLSLAEISEAVDGVYPDLLALDDYLEHQTINQIAAVLEARLGATDQS